MSGSAKGNIGETLELGKALIKTQSYSAWFWLGDLLSAEIKDADRIIQDQLVSGAINGIYLYILAVC